LSFFSEMRRTLALMRKEFKEFFRNRALLFIVIYMFSVDVYSAGTLQMMVNNHPLAVLDRDHTPLSRDLQEHFQTPFFRHVAQLTDEREIDDMLEFCRAAMILVIPEGFQREVASGRPADLQIIVDGTDSHTAQIATGYVETIVDAFNREQMGKRLGAPPEELPIPKLDARLRIWFNPNMNESWFVSLTELFNVVMVISVLLPAAAMVREKERGTIEQLMVSPLHTYQIMLAKVIPMVTITVIGTMGSIFLVLRPAYDLPLRGNVFLFFLLTALFVATTSGMGLLVSTLAETLPQTIMLTLVVLAPMMFLSGSWTPLEAMPFWMAKLTAISPLRYYLDIGFGILMKGNGIDMLYEQVLGMTVLGIFLFGYGTYRFRRMFS